MHAAAAPPRAAPPAQGPPAGAPAPLGAPATTVARTISGLLFDSNRTGNYEIFRSATDGSGMAQLTADRSRDSFWPKISPDHRQVLFYRTPAGVHDNNYTTASLWMMNADGTGQHVVIPVGANGWGFQAHAEWSPDGTRLAMIGGSAPNQQIYLTDADGSRPRLLTTDGHGGPRPGVNLDPSWGPDGHTLLFIGCDAALCLPAQQEVYRISADGTGERRLTADSSPDYDPYFSADGTRIAWLRDNSILVLPRWGVMMMNADGSNQHVLIDDGGINSKPNWSPDSSAIYFHRLPSGSGVFSVYRIPSAGGAPTEVLPDLGPGQENEYPDAY